MSTSASRATPEPTTDPTTEPAATTRARPLIALDMVVLDTDDPRGLARFYASLLDLPVVEEDEDWVTLGSAGGEADGVRLAFQLAINHRRPTWPAVEVPQQYHLDLLVQDMDDAVAFAESLGAVRLRNAGGGALTVLLDPSGHPFCLCR